MPPFAIDFIKVEKNGLKSAHSFWNMMIKLGFFSSIRREEQKKAELRPMRKKRTHPSIFSFMCCNIFFSSRDTCT